MYFNLNMPCFYRAKPMKEDTENYGKYNFLYGSLIIKERLINPFLKKEDFDLNNELENKLNNESEYYYINSRNYTKGTTWGEIWPREEFKVNKEDIDIYTGFSDIHGIPIFTRDFVIFTKNKNKFVYKIIYNYDKGMFELVFNSLGKYIITNFGYVEPMELYVIGNEHYGISINLDNIN